LVWSINLSKIFNHFSRKNQRFYGTIHASASFLKWQVTYSQQPQCGFYLLFLFLSYIVCRFGECQPPETARIEADGSLAAVAFELFLSFEAC
jgi:hypothetical protein